MTSVQDPILTKLSRLERDRERHQKSWDVLQEKLKKISLARSLETDPAEKFRLEKMLQEDEYTLSRLDNSINAIEQEIATISRLGLEKVPETDDFTLKNKLYAHLLILDFQEQQRLFEEVFLAGRDGAFLIQGEKDYGQGWLLRQLLEIISPDRAIEPIQIYLETSSQQPTMKVLWYRLGKQLFGKEISILSRRDHIDQLYAVVAGEVSRRLQAQHIVLVLNDVDFTYDEFLNRLILEFWHPLVNAVQGIQGQTSRFQLLLFFIDSTGRTKKWKKVAFIEQLDQTWESSLPIKLPKIKRFTNKMLSHWIGMNMSRVVRRNVTVPSTRESVQQLLKASNNGIPGETLKAIYQLCGYDECEWEEELDRKWRLKS